jgi:hypothetical protein
MMLVFNKKHVMTLKLRYLKIELLAQKLARFYGASGVANGSEIDALFESLAKMPVRNARAADEIMGYGSDGLPG